MSQFGGIILNGQASSLGNLKLTPDGFRWKAREGNRDYVVGKADLQDLEWLRGARGKQLKCKMKGGLSTRFEGFRDDDYDILNEYVLENKILDNKSISKAKQCSRGWNWGALGVEGSVMSLKTKAGSDDEEEEDIFELPLGNVSQVNTGVNELGLEFLVDDTTAPTDECLVEMRFAIPDEAHLESLKTAVKKRADTSAYSGESIVNFEQVQLMMPRGKFDIDLFPNYVKLHGKSSDFKILYTSISRLFLLPKPDEVNVAFIISLDPPIRQGNTMHPHLVLQFKSDETCEAELKLSKKDLEQKYQGKLEKEETGEMWRVFSKVVRHITQRPLHVPKSYQSASGQRAVRTALGAHEGYLFFLESSFFFVNRPPTYIRFEDVEGIEFQRMDLERRFDLSITGGGNANYLFSNIERSEFQNIFEFFKEKKLPVENLQELESRRGRATPANTIDVGSDDEESSEDEDFDPRKQKKADTAADKVRKKEQGDDDDDEDVDDEDEEVLSDVVDEEDEEGIGMSDSETTPPKKKKK